MELHVYAHKTFKLSSMVRVVTEPVKKIQSSVLYGQKAPVL